MKLMIRKRRWWWTVMDDHESVGMFDGPTFVRARTREKAIEKAQRRFGPKESPWKRIPEWEDETW